MEQFGQCGGSAFSKGDLSSEESSGRCWGLGFSPRKFPAQVSRGFHKRFWLKSSSGTLKSNFSPQGNCKIVKQKRSWDLPLPLHGICYFIGVPGFMPNLVF